MNILNKDERGVIEEICQDAHVLRITTKKGSRRAAHYHKTTGHWVFVTKGSIKYFERPVGSPSDPFIRTYKEGEIFYTGPLMAHLMLFEEYEDNEFLCFSTGKRDQINYENDLVRLDYNLDECIL